MSVYWCIKDNTYRHGGVACDLPAGMYRTVITSYGVHLVPHIVASDTYVRSKTPLITSIIEEVSDFLSDDVV
jgi:hypothetical protein